MAVLDLQGMKPAASSDELKKPRNSGASKGCTIGGGGGGPSRLSLLLC